MKPRYRELHAVYKRRYEFRLALLFPSTYQASLTSLGYQILYYLLNSFPEVYAERVVLDSEPPLSIETGSPLKAFDAVLVSSSFELDYPAVYRALLASGISPLRKERKGEDPAVIFGGPAPTANPEPLHAVADAVLRGEGEALAGPLVDALTSSRSKRELIDNVASSPCAWVPDVKEEAAIARVRDLDSAFHPVEQIQSLDAEPVWGRAYLFEPSRGCGKSCFFCLEGVIFGPRRERSLEKCIEYIERGVEANGVRKVAMYALRFFGSEQGEKLLEYLAERRLEASVPSALVDDLDERKVELIKAVGQKTLTVAPETPVPLLQRRIGKAVSREKLLEVAKAVAKVGMSLKLYYMIGLPGETLRDVEEIAKEVKELSSVVGKGKLKVSVSPFVPKPATVLAKCQMDSPTSLKQKALLLKKLLKGVARVEVYSIRAAYLQYKVNKMGRGAVHLFSALAEKLGARAAGLLEQRAAAGGLEEVG